MTPDAYQNAYDTAIAELTQITERFEQLRMRKGHIEGLVHALQPFFASSSEPLPAVPASAENPHGPEPQLNSHSPEGEPPEGYSFRDVPNPLPDISETGGDPFQRRARSNFRFRGLAMQRG